MQLSYLALFFKMHVKFMPPMVEFSDSFASFASDFPDLINLSPEMKSSYVPLIFFVAVNISTIRSFMVSHVIEMHLDYDTFFRFRCGFAIWSILPFVNFRQLRYLPCLRRNWAAKVDQSVFQSHKLVFERRSEISLTRAILGIGVPGTVWLTRDLPYPCGTLAIACCQNAIITT